MIDGTRSTERTAARDPISRREDYQIVQGFIEYPRPGFNTLYPAESMSSLPQYRTRVVLAVLRDVRGADYAAMGMLFRLPEDIGAVLKLKPVEPHGTVGPRTRPVEDSRGIDVSFFDLLDKHRHMRTPMNGLSLLPTGDVYSDLSRRDAGYSFERDIQIADETVHVAAQAIRKGRVESLDIYLVQRLSGYWYGLQDRPYAPR